MTDSPLPPHIPENELAEKIGVPRKVLLEFRVEKLAPEIDWMRSRSNAILILAPGLAKLCAHLDLKEAPAMDGAEKKEEAPMELTVCRLARRNPNVIFGREKKDGPEITVRVRSAASFHVGQEIRAVVRGNVAYLHGPQPKPRPVRPSQAPAQHTR